MKEMWDTRLAAPVVGVAVGTMENWRIAGRGPRFIKAGRKVVYDPDDIEAWKEANRFSSTSEAA
jgi:hypothetical protein